MSAVSEKHDHPHKQSMWHRWGLRRLLGRDDRGHDRSRHARRSSPNRKLNSAPGSSSASKASNDGNNNDSRSENITRRLSRKVAGVGLTRPTTFKRQVSERRDRLSPADPEPRRAVSADRQRPSSPQPTMDPRLSAPEVQWLGEFGQTAEQPSDEKNEVDDFTPELESEPEPVPVPLREHQLEDATDGFQEEDATIEVELERKWILNLSMHFRDRSEREKFFVTFAETPNRWRRVTISCDYRNAAPDSLEEDLKGLRYQRDKCARIYESIRESLSEIQFYDTVTNLKLETRDGRLHVHVTEDVNEIIPYPPVSCVRHLGGALFVPEDQLYFDSHLSGFVYKVQLNGKGFIKKEIPGPDTVDEFLYEINALHALSHSSNVIRFEAIVVDDRRELVKGLLISYADQGALVDILYEHRGEISWERRERWAKQIVHGLCEIHEAGYVQGDFTLSNIVVDKYDNAKIIDINRRGCPVGWEPPEIAAKIESNQRISMYIGVKTDLYQLGMTLWALAMEEDEPERQEHLLTLDKDAKVPGYYRRMVAICLSPNPRNRLSAKELLTFFPQELFYEPHLPPIQSQDSNVAVLTENHPSDPKEFSYRVPSPGLLSPPYQPAPDSLDDGYSSSRCGSTRDLTPPYTETNGHLCNPDEPLGSVADTLEDPSIEDPRLDYPPAGISFQKDYGIIGDSMDRPELAHDDSIQYSEDGGINLRPTADSLHREPRMDQDKSLQSFSVRTHPEELVGVEEHSACSFTNDPPNEPVTENTPKDEESSLPTPTTQCANRLSKPTAYPGHSYDGGIKKERTASVSGSLFHSILPINPALKSLTQEPKLDSSIRFSSGVAYSPVSNRPNQGEEIPTQTFYLINSQLPINPAITT